MACCHGKGCALLVCGVYGIGGVSNVLGVCGVSEVLCGVCVCVCVWCGVCVCDVISKVTNVTKSNEIAELIEKVILW